MKLLITNKQKEILLLLYRFRFLNRIQIQKLLKHKHHRRINDWLKNLVIKNYLQRIFEKKLGVNDPAIYYVSKNGIKFLKEQKDCEKEYIKKLYQESKRSKDFIDNSILIAGQYLRLLETEISPDSKFKFYTHTDFPRNGVIRDLLPSFAYMKEIDSKINYYVYEILKNEMPRFAMRARIQKYFDFFSENENIEIIFICKSEKQAKYVRRFSNKLIDEDDIENLTVNVITEKSLLK